MKKVANIIVTYNRLQLLKECVKSVREQTFDDFDIIVVNNGSIDGTEKWLSSQSDIITITQENLGGAGGFYTGMKTAFEKGYEWVWLMDDDGVADSKQLECLLQGAETCQSKYVNALVCNIADNTSLSFPLILDGAVIKSTEKAKKESYIKDSINPFNGTLIHRDVIKKIGFIKKEMFIWGDEIEYTQRAKTNGFVQYTITSAIHYHPTIKSPEERIVPFLGKYTVSIPANKERAFIKYRNYGYICKTYFPQEEAKEKLKYALYFLPRFKIKQFCNFIKYFNRGKNNNFEL